MYYLFWTVVTIIAINVILYEFNDLKNEIRNLKRD
jgi:hypothetical protein